MNSDNNGDRTYIPSEVDSNDTIICEKCRNLYSDQNATILPSREHIILEAEARLSVFENFFFLVDDNSSAINTNEDVVDEKSTLDGIHSNSRTSNCTNAMNVSDVMCSGYIDNDLERQEINNRLSVFDDFLFLVSQNVDEN